MGKDISSAVKRSQLKQHLLDLRKKAKTGQELTKEEFAFIIEIYEADPELYKEIDEEVQEWASDWKNWV